MLRKAAAPVFLVRAGSSESLMARNYWLRPESPELALAWLHLLVASDGGVEWGVQLMETGGYRKDGNT